MKLKMFSLFVILSMTFSTVFSQINAPDGLRIPGDWNSFSNSTGMGGDFDCALITQGTRRWQTTFQYTGTTGNQEFKIVSTNSGDAWGNQWYIGGEFTVNDFTLDTEGSVNWTTNGGSSNNRVSITNNNWYTFVWRDQGYGSTTAIFMETTSQPVTISSVAQSPSTSVVDPGTGITVTVTLSSVPSPEENVFIRYSTDNFATYGTLLSPSGGAGTASQTFSIPGQVNMTTLHYYVFTTTLASGTINGNETLTDLATIEFNNSGGVNYSIQFLPVEFTHFTAIPKGQQTQLDFATASETNNDYFEIQRSSDSRNWEVIGKVKGAGTTQQEQNYSFTDRHPQKGMNYYRLKQVDYDGQFEYSSIISIKMEEVLEGISIHPNPVQDHFQVNILPTATSMIIIDPMGRVAYRQKLFGQAGVEIQAQTLLPGTYQLILLDSEGEILAKDTFVKY